MLSADQITALQDSAQVLVEPVVEWLISDIAERIAAAGQFTSTAQYEIWRAQNLGLSLEGIKKQLRKKLNVTSGELERLLRQVAEVGYNYDLSRLPTTNAIPFEKNTSLQQIVDVAVKMVGEEMTNLTQTAGFVCPDGIPRTLSDAYRNACDYAFKKTVTGAQDYISAIRDATRGLAEKGIVTIDYRSGNRYTVEAAVRRSVVGGLGLIVEEVNRQNFEVLGCDGWEISAHVASAPDHEPIQGKQYPDEEYRRLNSSLVRRIGTLNCGHDAFGIILGVNAPQYTPEELEQMRQENEKGVTYGGKHYTLYEATQVQRKLERSIRRQKRRILVDEALRNTDKLQTDQIRYQMLTQEYKRFSKAAGLRTQYERMEVAGFTGKHGKAAENATLLQPDRSLREVQKPYQAVNTIKSRKSLWIENEKKPTTSNQGFIDITDSWYSDAKPGSHQVEDLKEYTVNGNTYVVDGHNVQLSYTPHEKAIAELLEREVGGEIFMVPRVNNPQGIKTPDYLFHGKGYDLKSLHKPKGKNPIFNRIQNAKGQSRNFILDLTDAELDEAAVKEQLEKVFTDKGTEFVDEIVIVQGGKIIKVLKRKKKS